MVVSVDTQLEGYEVFQQISYPSATPQTIKIAERALRHCEYVKHFKNPPHSVGYVLRNIH